MEGQALRDRAEQFEELGVTILGASYDTPAENLAFAQAQQFPFRLLSDTDHTVAAAYEVTRNAGDKFAEFPRRYSYLIDPDGVIARAYDVTDVARHADQVITDVQRAREQR